MSLLTNIFLCQYDFRLSVWETALVQPTLTNVSFAVDCYEHFEQYSDELITR